ncbi:MAG: hypothetical protein Q8O67_08335 [Deltaproteobacteria bacterium]|nr:hypothetical protein [Deltaproteobacteria bacterium]
MSRVDDGCPPPSAQEAERVQKEADKRTRDAKNQETDRQTFGKLLSGQKQTKESQGQDAKKQAEAKQGEHGAKTQQKGGAEAERAARMARGGTLQTSKAMEQAKGFQGALENTQQKSAGNEQGRVTTRDVAQKKDKVEVDDRQGDQLKKAEARKDADVDKAQVEAREAQRPNAAIGSDAGGGDPGGQGKDDGSAAAAAAIKASATTAPAAKASAKHEVKQIPPELLEKLVSTVYLAVTEKGLKEFQMEMKDGPLAGAFLKISAENGKVSLTFTGLDTNTKNLVEASKGDLLRRLAKKGLTLGKLDLG